MKKFAVICLLSSLTILPACSTKPVEPPIKTVTETVVIKPTPELLIVPDKVPEGVVSPMVVTGDIVHNKGAFEVGYDLCRAQLTRIRDFFSHYDKK